MTSLRIDGSPEQCRATAHRLRGAQRVFERLAARLAVLADATYDAWQGNAAAGFQASLQERRARAESLGLVARELAAGLDGLAHGLSVAIDDMQRAREAARAGGLPMVGDQLPPFFTALATPDPKAAWAAHQRARGLIELARAAEASAQEAWRVTLSGVLRELGVTLATAGEPDEPEESDGGIFDGVLPELPDLPSLPSLPDLSDVDDLLPTGPGFPTLPWDRIDEGLLGALGRAHQVAPWSAVPREALEQWLEDQDRGDLGLWERLGRAGLVGGTTLGGGVAATAVCRKFLPPVETTCTRLGLEGGSTTGNWIVDEIDAR